MSPSDDNVQVQEGLYRTDLAMIHDIAYGGYADLCAPGVLDLLAPVLDRDGTVLELGCGSGALTRHLIDGGHRVIATDGSSAMIELASARVPDADVRLLRVPDDPLPTSDAVVSVGHMVNYLPAPENARRALLDIGAALSPGGLAVLDFCDLSYGMTRAAPSSHAEVSDDWAILTRAWAPGVDRYRREITTFVKAKDGCWRRDDEVHETLLLDPEDVAEWLEAEGLHVTVRDAFGGEILPAGMRVLLIERT